MNCICERTSPTNMSMSGKFLYFAYGSNLLAQRIHINNPSAVRAGIGKLQDYELSFITFSKRWRGASATIINRPGKHVWGALWEIDNVHMDSLDRQEGVKDNIYFPMTVDVETPQGQKRTCRVYQQCATPENCSLDLLPYERKPSYIYLQTMISGAIESNLPPEYIVFLKNIPHNGYKGKVDIGLELNII